MQLGPYGTVGQPGAEARGARRSGHRRVAAFRPGQAKLRVIDAGCDLYPAIRT